jgi:hypothetical protein
MIDEILKREPVDKLTLAFVSCLEYELSKKEKFKSLEEVRESFKKAIKECEKLLEERI